MSLQLQIACRRIIAGTILLWGHAVLATPSDYAVPVTVSVTEGPPLIALKWPTYGSATQYQISSRPTNTTIWTLQATLTNAPATITGWTDSNAVVGTVYEYRVTRYAGVTGYGFTMSAIRRPAEESRGKVVLLVDSTKSAALSNELFRLHKDLAADGWSVLRHDVTPVHWNDTNNWKIAVTNIKAIIKADYDSDPARVKAVFLFGHIPVPYSGSINPDGHPDHQGAWPADMYYGDMDGNWTDTWLTSTQNTTRIKNAPGDGKFDQSSWPSTIDLQVGRVDLYDMPCFSGKTETNLLRQYLDKDHQYRYGGFTFQKRGLVDDNFGDFSGEAFAYDGWRNFGHMFGSTNVVSADFFTTFATNSYQWGYGCGAGNYTSASGVGSSTDFNTYDPRVVFTMMFGSYFGDWDVQNNYLRAPLGDRSFTLSCSWAGRPDNYYHSMTLGETLGECMRQSQNNSGVYSAVFDYGRTFTHIALMGDPTLRLHMITPPSSFNGTKSAGSADLTWTISPDGDVLGYNIYRSATYTGDFSRVNDALIAGTNYTDAGAPAGTLIYMLRPVSLEVSTSGSYTNIGQGIYAELDDTANSSPIAGNQTVTVTEDTPLAITLSGSDPETNSLTYAISLVPAHGFVTGALPNAVFCPATNFFGTDSFGFNVSDGKVESTNGIVSITVTPVNDAPVPIAQTITNVQGVSTSITLTATDVEGSALTYQLYSSPVHGVITGTTPSIIYTSESFYSGMDSFTFRPNDGATNGATATITIRVMAYQEPDNPAGTLSNGVVYQAYTGLWVSLPAFDLLTPDKSGITTNFGLSVATTSQHYAIRYRGYLNVTTNGLFTFFTRSADGSKLYIGTNEVVSNDGVHAAQERSGQIALKSGIYAITTGYFQTNATPTLTVSWSGPGISKQVIPNARLYYVYSDNSPVAIATASQTNAVMMQSVLFDGSRSYDTNGMITNFTWTFDDGGTGWTAVTNHTYTNAGTFSVNLVVTDNDGNAATSTLPVLVWPQYTTNGISVSWLMNRFGPTNDYTLIEDADPDGDGLSTREEFIAGTEPMNKASVFGVLELRTYQSSNAVLWYGTTNSGCTNRFGMDIRTNIVENLWSRKGSNLSRSASGTNLWWHTNTPPDTPFFYRVIIQ